MKSKLDRQLQELLASETDTVSEEGDEEEEITEVNIVPVTFEEKSSELALPENFKDMQEDYKAARSNLYGLMGRTNYAIDMALKLAVLSEHPKALEIAGTLMKNSAEISKDILSIHKEMNKHNTGSGGDGGDNKKPKGGKYIQNNYYGNSSPKDIEKELDDI